VFLRRYERRSGGRRRTYWALAESVRTKRGSRQRIVAYLGELAASEQSGWVPLYAVNPVENRENLTRFPASGWSRFGTKKSLFQIRSLLLTRFSGGEPGRKRIALWERGLSVRVPFLLVGVRCQTMQ